MPNHARQVVYLGRLHAKLCMRNTCIAGTISRDLQSGWLLIAGIYHINSISNMHAQQFRMLCVLRLAGV
jgi:hypothetical protein